MPVKMPNESFAKLEAGFYSKLTRQTDEQEKNLVGGFSKFCHRFYSLCSQKLAIESGHARSCIQRILQTSSFLLV